jgi:hypothetical protein
MIQTTWGNKWRELWKSVQNRQDLSNQTKMARIINDFSKYVEQEEKALNERIEQQTRELNERNVGLQEKNC